VAERVALARNVYTDTSVDPRADLPPAGFERVATGPYYAAYGRC
jgi:hypothetical protein